MRCEQPKYKIDSLGILSFFHTVSIDFVNIGQSYEIISIDREVLEVHDSDMSALSGSDMILIIEKELGRGESMNNVYQSQSCSSLPESQQNQHSTL